jgi:hypothetical protein
MAIPEDDDKMFERMNREANLIPRAAVKRDYTNNKFQAEMMLGGAQWDLNFTSDKVDNARAYAEAICDEVYDRLKKIAYAEASKQYKLAKP